MRVERGGAISMRLIRDIDSLHSEFPQQSVGPEFASDLFELEALLLEVW